MIYFHMIGLVENLFIYFLLYFPFFYNSDFLQIMNDINLVFLSSQYWFPMYVYQLLFASVLLEKAKKKKHSPSLVMWS